MLTEVFIENLHKDIQLITTDGKGKTKNAFIGFTLISLSIEMLGGCFDNFDWYEKNLSEIRFRIAVKKLFPSQYQRFNIKGNKFDLYVGLRCPMVHQLLPGKHFGLSERKNTKIPNLTIQNGLLICIYEDFFNDFKKACIKLRKKIAKGKLLPEKVYKSRISVPSDYK